MSRYVVMLARAYGYLLGIAAGGFIGGMFAGFIPVCIEIATSPQERPDSSFYKNWVHGGWWVGAGLFAAAAIVHWWRKPLKSTQAAEGQLEHSPEPDEEDEEFVTRPIKSRTVTIGLFGLCGAFLGLFFGGSLMLLWFSLTLSPFGPESWNASLSLTDLSVNQSRPRHAMATNHPFALYAFFGPIVLGAIAGAVMGTFPKATAFTVD
jgi:hypothetical protein